MKILGSLIILGMFMLSSVLAQDPSAEKLEEFATKYGRITSPKYQGLKGSPYLVEDFIPGEIKLESGEALKLNLRFNVYDDEFEFESNNGIRVLKLPERVSRILLGDSEYIYLESYGEEDESSGYFKLVAGDEYRLLIKHNKIFIPSVAAGAYEPATEAELRNHPDVFYLAVSGKHPVKLKRKKKFIIELIPAKEEEISRYIKDEKISLHKKSDLIDLIDYLNTSM